MFCIVYIQSGRFQNIQTLGGNYWRW